LDLSVETQEDNSGSGLSVETQEDDSGLSVPGSSARENLLETTGRHSMNKIVLLSTQGPATDSDYLLVVLGSTAQVHRPTL